MRKHVSESKKKRRYIVPAILLSLISIGAVTFAIRFVLGEMQDVYERQCIVGNAGEQIEIITGKIVPAKLIALHFGLTNGANLAQIPFATLRNRLLADMPNLRDVRISRHQQNYITVEAIERVPTVRILGVSKKSLANRVADSEGMVFVYPRRETQFLPILRDTSEVKPGERLSGMAASALVLLDEAGKLTNDVLRIQEVNTSKQDYLTAILGDSSTARIAWDRMYEDSKAARTSLVRQLRNLSDAIRSRVADGTTLWNATDYGFPSRIYANDPSKAE